MKGFVVRLSDNSVITEKDMSWIELKETLQENLGLRIAEMYLQYDHQKVFLPNYAKVYFYSKKVEAYVGANKDQRWYHGVGASDKNPDEVTITWYDGNNAREERRAVIGDNPAFIVAP
jgi:hypothetical protein